MNEASRVQKLLTEQNAEIDRLKNRIEQLETALRNIAEGDIPRTVRTVFRDDGKPTKNDRCGHGQWMYEECGCCIEDYARTALGEKKDEK
jgi:hypothetical protein